MKRRRFVQLSGTAIATVLAGCSSGDDGQGTATDDGKTEDKRLQLGESATHEGVKVTVNKYALADSYRVYETRDERYPEDSDSVKTPPTAGGIFLFAHVTVENTGDKRRPFPQVGDEGIRAKYNGQRVQMFYPENKVKTGRGDEYTSYFGKVEEKNAQRQGAFPGVTIEGWVIAEAPRTLNPSDFTFNIRWGSESLSNRNEKWTFGNKRPTRTPEGYENDYESEETATNSGNQTQTTTEGGNETTSGGNETTGE